MEELSDLINNLITEGDTDLYLFNGGISYATVDKFMYLIRDKENTKKCCSLVLTTYGGDPNAGYRLVRFIKQYYDKFKLYVFGMCKSTGTLIALGADEIIMSDFGEFGPLDIQLTKDDELSRTSGLNLIQSLERLTQEIFQSFETTFLGLKDRSGYTITTKTAGEIASKLAVGLIAPISAQIEPVKLGEVLRSMRIADWYGSRLNDNEDLIAKLIAGYPSHGFVIDFKEAVNIFGKNLKGENIVRVVNDAEQKLERYLIKQVRREDGELMLIDLSALIKPKESDQNGEEDRQNNTIDNAVTVKSKKNIKFANKQVPNEQSNENDESTNENDK